MYVYVFLVVLVTIAVLFSKTQSTVELSFVLHFLYLSQFFEAANKFHPRGPGDEFVRVIVGCKADLVPHGLEPAYLVCVLFELVAFSLHFEKIPFW